MINEDAVVLLKKVDIKNGTQDDYYALNMAISALKHERLGFWINDRLGSSRPYRCILCNVHHRALYKFCPHCGARMKNAEEEAKNECYAND